MYLVVLAASFAFRGSLRGLIILVLQILKTAVGVSARSWVHGKLAALRLKHPLHDPLAACVQRPLHFRVTFKKANVASTTLRRAPLRRAGNTGPLSYSKGWHDCRLHRTGGLLLGQDTKLAKTCVISNIHI